jgi:hypothetical protein
VPGLQVPVPSQVEMPEQTLPPHVVPLAAGGFEQVPLDGLQVPATWHASSAVHAVALPEQTPEAQTSFVVHALPSLQAVPFGALGLEHVPVDGSHEPAT